MSRAAVRVGDEVVGSIGRGLCVLLAVGGGDDDEIARHLADRVSTLRVFDDGTGRMNLDVSEVGGAVLVVSQFTLYAGTSRGHRPSFTAAAPPAVAARLCEVFATRLSERGLRTQSGRFGARMDVELVNSGPVTLVLTSGEGPWPADAG